MLQHRRPSNHHLSEQAMADESVQDCSGIYEIINAVNGKRYVGGAASIRKRWAEHRRDLTKRRHHSVSLQRAWDKYGEQAFSFGVIESCAVDDLISREQAHIDAGTEYNICMVAGSTRGFKMNAESRAKLSSKLIGNKRTKGYKYSREICERMAAPKRGRKLPPRREDWCLRISESKKGNKYCAGRQVSQETRDKIAQSLLGRKSRFQSGCPTAG